MSLQLNVLPWVIDVSKQLSDERLIDEFDWEIDDHILVLLENEFGHRYWDIFKFTETCLGEETDFFRPDGESLTELLENESVFLVRWIPLRFND